MITTLEARPTRHVLNIETEQQGIAAVTVTHTRVPVEERERVDIEVQTDDDNIEVVLSVRAS